MSTPNSSFPVIGSGIIIRQPGGSFQVDRTGLAVSREKFIGYYNDIISGMPLRLYGTTASTSRSYKTPSPFASSLLLYSGKVTLGKGVLNGILEVEYRGLDPSLSSPPPPVYTLERVASNEPLTSHPNWATTIAGTPFANPGPLNGAIFVDKNNTYNPSPVGSNNTTPFDATTATFSGWLAKSKYRGTEDYLCPGGIWKSSYVSFNPPADMGNIGSPETPEGPVPNTFAPGYNWLNMGVSFTDNAGLYRIEKSWRLSGPNGWDANIYPGPSGLTPPGTLLGDGTITS